MSPNAAFCRSVYALSCAISTADDDGSNHTGACRAATAALLAAFGVLSTSDVFASADRARAAIDGRDSADPETWEAFARAAVAPI